MIDSHAHIYAEEFKEDLREVMLRSQEVGISKILLPNIDVSSIDPLNQLVRDYPDLCYRMMGLHPCSVQEDYREQLARLKEELDKGDCIAVGEIGTDLYWDQSTKDIQIEAFLEQCQWAVDRDLPVVIHSRETLDLNIGLLEQHFQGRIKGVFHCFTGTKEEADRIIALGMKMGLGGVLTFKNTHLREELAGMDPEHFLLETDAPYLAPVPYRGKRNEPSYMVEVQHVLAGVLGCDESELHEILESNTLKLFKI